MNRGLTEWTVTKEAAKKGENLFEKSFLPSCAAFTEVSLSKLAPITFLPFT